MRSLRSINLEWLFSVFPVEQSLSSPRRLKPLTLRPPEQSELDSPEPSGDTSHQSGEPEVETQSEVEQSESFDFDLDLPLPAGDEEPQPTMVFDPSSLEQAVSDAFGPSESPGEDSRASAEISDDFFDAPDDSSGLESMPAAFSLDPSEDGLATRQLDAGNLEVSTPESSGLPDLNLDALDQPTMVLPSRETEPKRATNPTPMGQRHGSCRLETRRVVWMQSTSSMTYSTVAKVYQI